MSELRTHVREELAEPDGVVVIDPSAFPKKGTESCGVDRQWCGRLGKVDNCQVGVFLAYAATGRLRALGPPALPARGLGRRRGRRAQVPRPCRRSSSRRNGRSPWTSWTGACPACPTAGSSATTSSAGPPSSGRRCVSVGNATSWTCPATPRCATWSGAGLARRRAGRGRKREVPFQRADAWAKSQPESRWTRLTVRDGEKGPLEVDAMVVPGPGQAGRPDRPGGTAGGHPSGGRVADRLRPEQRRAPRCP